MHDFNQYVKKRIPSMIGKSIKINELMAEELDTVIKKTSILVDFYALQFNEDAELVVPIGTKDKPTGLSRISDSYIVVTHLDNRPLFYIHSEDLKEYIKDIFSQVETRMSDEYKLSVVLKYAHLADNAEEKDQLEKVFFNI
jgi:hypothetical protein